MPAAWRTVRVFVSSTFRDMHAEREELVKRVFPQLRKLCEERGVGWTEVDLRWGVTEEQAQRGEVLPICLAEIDRCRPYFIGLLGERYGWVPDEIPAELVDDQPWLAEHRGQSITELEILHGVLRNPAMANRAYFYLRNPAYVDRIPADQRDDFVEADPEARAKLATLKERILASGQAVRDYPDPLALGELVVRDLTVAINQEFPPEESPDALQREALEHEAFAQSRTGVYIGRPEYFDRLDAHAASSHDGPGLVVLGGSGSGKSALLANWATSYRQDHPDDVVLMHFIGVSPYGADWAAMLRRILGELKRRFGIEQEIPDQPDALRAAFGNWLHMAAARAAHSSSAESGRRIVLIVDALSQLEDRDGAPDLVWLPPVIPGGVRLVVSTLPGRPLDELARRDWPTLQVQPFDPDERRQFVGDYLARFTKSLSPERIERIATAPASANPLYLQALLEELRVFGVHERLDERIDHYLAATTVDGLYERILERYEADYERDHPGLVRDAMTLLWAARRGLSEPELLDMLGSNGEPLARAHWSPLYLAAEASLVSRSGLLGFFHDYLRKAVQNRYLPTVEAQNSAHLRVADYFERQELTRRKIDELPWQLAASCGWDRLHGLLAAAAMFTALWENNRFDVLVYWQQLESESRYRLHPTYSTLASSRELDSQTAEALVNLLDLTGNLDLALALASAQVQLAQSRADAAATMIWLDAQAAIHFRLGDLDLAEATYESLARVYRDTEMPLALQDCLGKRGMILEQRGQFRQALELFQEQERICDAIGFLQGLADSLRHQGIILRRTGTPTEALPRLEESERTATSLGDQVSRQRAIGEQGCLFAASQESERAMQRLDEQEAICRRLGLAQDLATCLMNKAHVCRDLLNDSQRAMELYRQIEQLAREGNFRKLLAEALGNQGALFAQVGELETAEELFERQQRIAQEIDHKEGIVVVLGRRAGVMAMKGQRDGDVSLLQQALVLFEEQERVARQIGTLAWVGYALINQANILHQVFRETRVAFSKCREGVEILRETGQMPAVLQQGTSLLRQIEGCM